MLLETLTIDSEPVFVTRLEVAFVEQLQHTISVKGAQPAAEMWLQWATVSVTPGTIKRRMVVGKALGLAGRGGADDVAAVESQQRRNACSLHVFDMRGIERIARKVPPRLRCVMCLEWMDTVEACAYARGFAAAGGDPETVIEGFGR